MKYEIVKVKSAEMKTPKGYRLIEDWELLKLSRTDKDIRRILVKGWIWCNTRRGVKVADFTSVKGQFRVFKYEHEEGCYLGRSRRVFIKIGDDKYIEFFKDMEVKKNEKI